MGAEFSQIGRTVYVNEGFIQRLRRIDPSSIAVGAPRGGYTWATSDDSEGDFYFTPRKDLSGEFVEGWYVVSYTPGHLMKLTQVAGSMGARKVAGYDGNPDGKDIYPNKVDHGYDEPLAGGTDVMRRLQNRLLHEQGNDDWVRPESPRLSSYKGTPVERVASRYLVRRKVG